MSEKVFILPVFLKDIFTEYTALSRDFPGSPVVKSLPFNAGGMGLLTGQGTKVLRAARCGQKPK